MSQMSGLVWAAVIGVLVFVLLLPMTAFVSEDVSVAAEGISITAYGSDWRESFARELLTALGNPSPADSTVIVVIEWTMSEDGSDGAWSRGNPLNTTQCTGADTGGCPDAVDATLQTVTNGLYDDIVAALQTDADPETIRQLIWDSPWAASHYNGGSDWSRL